MYLNNIDTSSFSKIQYLYSKHMELGYPVLKGMFERGIAEHGLSNEDDEFLDVVALLLIKLHQDKTILPIIVDMIFFRNRKGLFTHDLIWAFFQARDPYSLMLIANYLISEDANDVKLACKLLDFVPSIDMTMGKNSEKQYVAFFYWLEENYPFLYFTGESFQRTSKPIPYIVTLDAKYLCKQVSPYTGKTFIPYTAKENNLLYYFNHLDESDKLLLSSFSRAIHYENIYLWKSWINHSIIKQISIAKARLGT
ncbi:hypothetical protein [Clostridium tagluense]|uniref:hypothetical protein n=1 Tax=Clostridium tagluense TaxID=360422 RepID=UPI001C0C56DD|nr:hypothetical protein [Clostridium tagluense]MBU3129772.1 hypothetical protein [Clostridium tagluense]